MVGPRGVADDRRNGEDGERRAENRQRTRQRARPTSCAAKLKKKNKKKNKGVGERHKAGRRRSFVVAVAEGAVGRKTCHLPPAAFDTRTMEWLRGQDGVASIFRIPKINIKNQTAKKSNSEGSWLSPVSFSLPLAHTSALLISHPSVRDRSPDAAAAQPAEASPKNKQIVQKYTKKTQTQSHAFLICFFKLNVLAFGSKLWI